MIDDDERTMQERYNQYRSYGHGVFISLLAAPSPGMMLFGSSIVGIIIGISLGHH